MGLASLLAAGDRHRVVMAGLSSEHRESSKPAYVVGNQAIHLGSDCDYDDAEDGMIVRSTKPATLAPFAKSI